MRKIIGYLALYLILIGTALYFERPKAPLREPQSIGRPTGDYCSKQGDYMFYLRRISGPDACFKEGK